MNNILTRLLALARITNDEGMESATLSVHLVGGDWIAAICPFASKVPLLDSNGDESLAARGNTPRDAIRALDNKLWGLA